MYYLMTGEHPPAMATLDYRRDLSFDDLEAFGNLVAIVKKMCEHDPAKRYASARDVIEALKSPSSGIAKNFNDKTELTKEDIGVLRRKVENYKFSEYAPAFVGILVEWIFEENPNPPPPLFVDAVNKYCEREDAKKRLLKAESTNPVLHDLEQKVKSTRNTAITSVASIAGGSALGYVGYVAGATTALEIASLVFGSTLALTGLASYGAFRHQYWTKRKELQAAKKIALAEITSPQEKIRNY